MAALPTTGDMFLKNAALMENTRLQIVVLVVKPCHCDWSTEDGVIFQNMVLDKEFVALVHEVTKDDHDSSETILGLALIDTSN
ncbi:unnamed protein product, partial [Timema podura]|nr:unnamed protein product [Timema podura]